MKTKKQTWGLMALFTVTYMVSYITRVNYGAVILDMVQTTGQTKSALSMALTGSFITYGLGQIVSGVCGDKLSPKWLVFGGLTLSSAMNITVPFCSSPYQMLAVWCINGFAQAFMWPPIVRLMSGLFSEEEYKKASVTVSWGSSFGTVFVYLTAPLLISALSWKFVFWLSAVCGIAMASVWAIFCKDVPKEPTVRKEEKQTSRPAKKIFTPLFFCILFAIVLQGSLRDGVTTWMPSYISETYRLSGSISILTGVVLPIFGIVSFYVGSVLYRKKLTNPMTCAGFFFAVGSGAALLLFFFSDANVILSVFLSALLTGCMHGVNLILITMIPPFYKKYGNVATVSGILNSCTYVGSAISTYGIAVLSETKGWNVTLGVWFLIAFVGAVVCFLCKKAWNKAHCD